MIDFDQKNFHHKYDLMRHTAEVVANTPPIKHIRFAALLHDIAKPICQSFDENSVAHYYKYPSIGANIADEIMIRLKADNSTREKVVKLIKWHDTPIDESERIIKRKLRSIGKSLLFDLYELQKADTLGLADEYHNRLPHFKKLKEITDEILNQEQCFSLKDLNLNGHDVSSLGLTGKSIGAALNFALEAVMDGTENNKDVLIKLIKENADSF
jgi:tRNA nucleotidyltransferase (CCA-adding enzyme)